MVEVTAGMVKEMRQRSGAGVMDCKRALVESKGSLEEAVKLLRKQGKLHALKKSGRETADGTIASYIHPGGKIGVLVEVNCETDFVARTDDFRALVKDITMQVAAATPSYIRREEVPESVLQQEREIASAQFAGKPQNVVEKIVKGKMEKFFSENCLMEQPFVKEPETTVGEHVTSVIGKLGENIRIRRFVRYQLGGG